MAKKKLTNEEKEEREREGELPKKSVIKNEEKQLLIFFIVIGAVFASFLIPYFYAQSLKSFEFAHADWTAEEYENIDIFHGRFISFASEDKYYNLYLRNDPRKNDIESIGNFTQFKYNAVIAASPEIDYCEDKIVSTMTTLGMFLKQGVGLKNLSSATTDNQTAYELGRPFLDDCSSDPDKMTILITQGNSSSVVQDENDKYCYRITMEKCNDKLPLEKFMLNIVDELGQKRDEYLESKGAS